MKKILFGVAALGLLGLAGAGIGLKAQDTVEAKAGVGDNSAWGLVGTDGETASIFAGNAWSPSSKYFLKSTDNSIIHSWRRIPFKGGEQFKAMTGTSWDGSDIGWNQTFGPAKEHFVFAGSDNNIKVNDAGTYDVAVATNGDTGAKYIGLYPEGALDDVITADSCIYVCELPNDYNNWNPNHVYTFGGLSQFGSFDSQLMDDVPGYQVSIGLNLGGTYGNVKKIPYSSLMQDNQFIIHNGSGYKSNDTSLANGAAYYFNSTKTYGNTNLNADTDLGKAAEFILKAEAFRNAVAEDDVKGIFAKSICGIDPADIATILADYAALTDEQKDYVNDTTVNTYVENASSEYDKETTGTVRYEDIIAELTELAKPKAGVMRVVGSSKDDSTLMIVAGITTVTVLAGASVLIARKRRVE